MIVNDTIYYTETGIYLLGHKNVKQSDVESEVQKKGVKATKPAAQLIDTILLNKHLRNALTRKSS